MNKFNLIIQISQIIARDINGQLIHDEKVFLKNWINRSEANQKLYQKILDKNRASERNKLYDEIDTERAWRHVAKSLGVQPKRSIVLHIMKYAAAILLPVLLGFASYFYLDEKKCESNLSTVEIMHGSRSAVLVMSNGEKVKLLKDSAKTLLENDGTLIDNGHNELSYAGQQAGSSKSTLVNTLIVPKGGEYSLVLSDGTRVFVNAMSKLVFPVRFSGNKREISLEGEAYFDVTKDKSKPFIVTIKGMQVEVLGTAFNIKAYPDDNRSFTTLVEGKVKLSSVDQSSKECFLEPDQQAVYDQSDNRMVINRVDARQIMQWTSGRYSFTDETLEEIMRTLSRWYDFNYKFENESINKIRFEGGLNKYESINPILDIIKETGKVKVTVKNRDVLFSKI